MTHVHRTAAAAVTLVAVVCAGHPQSVLAQNLAADTVEKTNLTESPGEGPHSGVMELQALWGVTTYTGSPPTADDTDVEPPLADMHRFYGGRIQLHVGGWGLLGLVERGSGQGYDSLLYGGGLSRRIFAVGRLRFSLFAGYGRYRETGITGTRRAIGAPLGGAVMTFDIGLAAFSAMFTDLYGTYDSEQAFDPVTVHVPRVNLGLGLSL